MNESSVLTSTALRYEDAFGSAGVPSWTGNISSWSWTQAGQGERSYVFGYDGLGRLTTTSQYLGSSLEDKYGSESPIVVKYNILNLPAQETTEGDLSAKARYLSDGTKLCIVNADESRGYYHYGPFRRDVPSGTDLNVSVPGGLVWACEDVYTVRYISADHLGSTRLVTDESGSVVEQFDYLPYGEMCQNSTYPVAVHEKTDYLYTGKELQQFFGIDWYDSKARFQTTSGVFTSPDPLAEKYYSLSPYAYCAGDPVNLVDPDGLSWFFDEESGEYYAHFDDDDDRIYLISAEDNNKAKEKKNPVSAYRRLRNGDKLLGDHFDKMGDDALNLIITFFYNLANSKVEGGSDKYYTPGIVRYVNMPFATDPLFVTPSMPDVLRGNNDYRPYRGYDLIMMLSHEVKHQLDIDSGELTDESYRANEGIFEIAADSFALKHWSASKAKYAFGDIIKHMSYYKH